MKQALYGWTDYPFTDLGDVSGKPAPLRPCKMVRYDGDKYCDIIVSGTQQNIKSGYVYRRKGRCGDVPTFRYRDLCALIGNDPRVRRYPYTR